MIDVTACHIQHLGCCKVIHIRLHAEGMSLPPKVKIVGDELIGTAVFPDDLGLAAQKLCHLTALERFKRTAKASVDGAHHAGEFFPGVDPVAPVVQAEVPVQALQIPAIAFSHGSDEHLLHILAAGSEMFCLVVQLKADHAGIALHGLHQLPDNPLRIEAIGGMGDVHDLPGSVRALSALIRDHDLRIGLGHPCRNRVGRCAHDYMESLPLTGVQHPGHMGEIKYPVLRLLAAPGGFRDADHVQPRLLHHANVFVQPFIGHIFIIICRSV